MCAIMNYNQAMEHLKNLTKFGINLGLERITELLRRLGNPHLQLKIIHVGGTNGKGSVANMIAAILQSAGYKTGIFTSPHLHRYTERYRINGQQISELAVATGVSLLKPHLEEMVAGGFEHPTEFEVSTALAFCYFHQQQTDFVVLEVGLGGAIDSTNVVRPLVSVITNVSMDHMEYLGDTVTEIATVKAGIIKQGVPVVTAEQKPAVLAVIKATCNRYVAPLTVVGEDVTWCDQGKLIDRLGQKVTVIGQRNDYPDLYLPLLGDHQQINVATALATLETLVADDVIITPEIVQRGLARLVWPGRFEVLTGEPTVVLDGAHNLAGAKALATTLCRYFPDRQVVLVLGMLADKERQKVMQTLVPLSKAVVVTKPNSPRALTWQQIATWARQYVPAVEVCEQIPTAVNKGLAIADPADVVCITGSLYMLAEAREHLFRRTATIT